jgi:L-lactate utilization protein LutB
LAYIFGSTKRGSWGGFTERPTVSSIPPINVVEPSAEQSKHRAASIFVRKERRLNIDEVKEHLKEIRESTRDNTKALLEELEKTLGQYSGLKITKAKDAKEAARYIRQAAGDISLASINKSNVVVNELRPELQASGFKTYLRYFTEFKNFEVGKFQKKVEDYWSLPGMHGRNLVESFGTRKEIGSLTSTDTRDYIAILGVNAISADDGSVFFLQHMSNISKDLAQAKKIVFVVSLEKVLKTRQDALFHTRSMGIFGLESILLDLIPNNIENYDFDTLPALPEGVEREVHVLFLDNGRTELLKNGYRDLFLCIDCRACARQCPVGQHFLHERGMVYSPKNYLLGFLQGWLPSVEVCLHCGRCEVECPVDIEIPTLLWKSQVDHYAHHKRSWKKRMLDDPEILAKLGTLAAPFSTWMTSLRPVKQLMQLFTGVHRDSHLPAFHRKTFRKWLKGGRRDE